jgi:hypothetical protein
MDYYCAGLGVVIVPTVRLVVLVLVALRQLLLVWVFVWVGL